MAGIALINGRNFAHQDTSCNIGGVPITSLSDITISKSRIREYSYGTQPEPVGYGDGKKNAPELTFTMSKTDADALELASPGNDVLNLDPFDIPLTATHPTTPRFKILKNVLITQTEESSDEDTTDIKVAFTAICSHIQNIF
jgi:hypothetical protein